MSFMLEISFVYMGITITLTLYHLFIFLGRRHEVLHLAYVFFAVALMLTIVFSILWPFDFGFIMPVGAVPTSILFFVVTLLRLKKWLKLYIVSSLVLGAATLNGMLLTLVLPLEKVKIITYPFMFAFTALTVPIIVREMVRRGLYRDREKILVISGLAAGIAGCLVNAAIHLAGMETPFVVFETMFMFILVFFSYVVTRRFNLEHAQLRELNARLEQKVMERTRQAEAKEEQKTRFFINLAHETKTPLTLISGCLDEYMKGREENQELHVIRQNIEKLKLDMINFLDHEKLEKGKIFYDHGKVIDAARIATMQAKLFGTLARIKKIKVTLNIEDGILLRIDPSAWERILNNLLDNAVKYTDENGFIALSLSGQNANTVLTVTDTGRGISPEEQENIWKPFFQLSHHKRNLQGIGMGLAIVKRIAADAGGRVSVMSIPGSGTEFSVILPAVPPGETGPVTGDYLGTAAGYDYRRVTLKEDKFKAGRTNVLLVDDNLEMLYYLQKKLSGDCNVFCAANGREALSRLEIIPRPHLIVSDVMMDDMDGNAFFEETRRREALRSVPFIFLTALSSHNDKIRGIKKGAVDYICKPFNMDELMAKIASIDRVQKSLAAENIEALTGRLAAHFHQGEGKPDSAKVQPAPEYTFRVVSERYGITKKQMEIIALLRIGLERKEVAWKLGLSLNTVKTQLKRIFEKCKIENKTELFNIFSGL